MVREMQICLDVLRKTTKNLSHDSDLGTSDTSRTTDFHRLIERFLICLMTLFELHRLCNVVKYGDMWKEEVMACLRRYLCIRLHGLRKTVENFSHDSQHQIRKSKPGTIRMRYRSAKHVTTTFEKLKWSYVEKCESLGYNIFSECWEQEHVIQLF
jgi:hypothetical protein